MTESDPDVTLRWKLDKDIEVYLFYLDVSIKASVFLMAVAGGIASYVLSKPVGTQIPFALAFPALLNAGFAVLFFKSIAEARRIARVHTEVCKKVGVPEFNMDPLRAVCVLFFLMCSVAAVGLLLLVVLHPQ